MEFHVEMIPRDGTGLEECDVSWALDGDGIDVERVYGVFDSYVRENMYSSDNTKFRQFRVVMEDDANVTPSDIEIALEAEYGGLCRCEIVG